MPAITIEQALQMAIADQQAGRLPEAEEACRRILAVQPGSLRATVLLGNILSDLGRWAEAEAAFQRALQIAPDRPEVHFNLGNTYAKAGTLEMAIASYRQALALRPDFQKAHANLGNVLMESDRLEESISHFRRALALQPDGPEMHYGLGVALSRAAQWDEAIACLRRASELQPDYADPYWALAPILLRLGQYEEGWRIHARYGESPDHVLPARCFPVPKWDGTSAQGETILIYEEQGHGDAIQFLRFIPFIRERSLAGKVIVECASPLFRLVRQSPGFGAEIVEPDAPAAPLPPFHRHLPFLDLPFVLERWAPLPMAEPYLQADPASRAVWREKLRPRSHFRVGLAWAGNPRHRNDRRRSMPPEKLRPLFRIPGITFHSLQMNLPAGQPQPLMEAGLIDLTDGITDFADTAALVAELDLVITVDTAVAHLAGALGRPVWTLLPFVPDWRWGLDREDTPWYPSMRLFRQPTPGDWESVIRRVAKELSMLTTQRT